MRIKHTRACALASALLATAGLSTGARADEKPQKEKQIERVVVKASQGEASAVVFAPRSDAAPARDARRRVIGVTISNVSEALAAHLGVDRARTLIIDALDDDGPAANAGLRVHDLIVGINGEDGCSIDKLSDAIRATGEDGVVRLRVRRGSDERVVVVKPRVVIARAVQDEATKAGDASRFFLRLEPGGFAAFSPPREDPEAPRLLFNADENAFVFRADGKGENSSSFELYSQQMQALKALNTLEGLLEGAKAGSDASDALERLRKALQSTRGSRSADFSLPRVEFLSIDSDDEDEHKAFKIKTSVGVNEAKIKSDAKVKSMYIPSIELDGVKVVVDDKSDGNFVNAITVGPKSGGTLTLLGALSGELDVAKALALGDSQLLGVLKSGQLEGVGGVAVLKALEGVRAAASASDDASLRQRLESIEKQLDRIEALLQKLLSAIE